MHVGLWPAITRRQSPPSPLPRQTSLGAGECGLWLGASALVDDAVLASEVDDERARRQLEEAQAELERVDRGESSADRWQLEQRIRHAENQLTVSGRS